MSQSTRLDASLTTFLEATGAHRGLAKLGPGDKPEPPSPAAMKLLIANLEQVGRQARVKVSIRIALIFCIFVGAAALAYYHRDDMKFIGVTILGGSGVMVWLLNQLRVAQADQTSTALLIALLPNVPPDEWAKYVGVLLDEVVGAAKGMQAGRPSPAS